MKPTHCRTPRGLDDCCFTYTGSDNLDAAVERERSVLYFFAGVLAGFAIGLVLL